MSRPADFEKARRKKVRRGAFLRFVTFALAVGLAFTLYTYRYEITSQGIGVLLSDRIAELTHNSSFPATLPDEPVELLTVGSRPAVVTESSVNVFNPVGEEKYSLRITGESTLARSAGNYLLTFARGGYELRVQSGETEMFSLRTDTAILDAAIARNGSVAVATAQDGSSFCVRVYNSRYEQVFEWIAGDLTITAIALDDGASSLAVGGVYSDGGALCSRVRAFSVRDGEELLSRDLPEELLLSLTWRRGGSLTAVGDRGAYFLLTQEGESEVSFDGALCAFAVLSDGSVAAATGDYLTAHEVTLTLYSPQGDAAAALLLRQDVRSILPCDGGLLVFTGERVLRYSDTLERISVTETPGALGAAAAGKSLYYVTVSHLYRTALR